MAQYTLQANNRKVKYIILRKNVPVLEITPIDEKEYVYTKLFKDLEESEKQIKEGKFYSQEEVMNEFGLR
jgi:hypothetical protein